MGYIAFVIALLVTAALYAYTAFSGDCFKEGNRDVYR